jgi:hypothetical protein
MRTCEAQSAWFRKRTERIDWMNEELRRQGHAVKTFKDVDAAMREYYQVTGQSPSEFALGAEPQLSDFYTPSDDQKDREIAFVAAGMAVTGLSAYIISKYP